MGHDTCTGGGGGATSSIPPGVLTWTRLSQGGPGAKKNLGLFLRNPFFCEGHAAEKKFAFIAFLR